MSKTIRQQMFTEMADKSIFRLANEYAFDYADKALDRNVFPDKQAIEQLKAFEEPLPDSPSDAADLIQKLHEYGSPASVSQTGGRYFGLVNGGVIPASLAARWLSDFWDQNTPLYLSSPIASKLEEVVEDWLRELLGLPKNVVAGFVSGSSMAIFCGLAAARYRVYQNSEWDVNQKGLNGAPKIRIIASRQAHATVIKAISLLGLGLDNIEWITTDDQGRIDAAKIPQLDKTCILLLQAGNVNSGAFDDFDTICKQANTAGAWVHIDGAFGLWATACEKFHALTSGISLAQSWSVDGHKTLNTPYDCGVVLCSDRDALVQALHATGSYIVYSDNRDGMLYTPEMSRRARVVELWAALKYLGKSGVDELVYGLHLRACQFAEELTRAGFEVLNEVVFNQILIKAGNADETADIIKHIQQSGECWVGGAQWFDQAVIRISVCSWATTEEDVLRSVQAFIRARDEQ